MKAAIVREFGHPPVYGDFADPDVRAGETAVIVRAAAANALAVMRAAGTHYSAGTELPFVPGVDGAGRLADGRRVYFGFVRPPFGSMAEKASVPNAFCIPLPEGMDEATAAAAGNSGLSCWIPLTRRARIAPGESVLVNGASGSAGRMAVQVAKHLGAQKVIATGRNPGRLKLAAELGADVTLSLDQPPAALREALRREAHDAKVGVVLDYLWGPSAEVLLDALGGPNAPRGSDRVRYVQVGSSSAPTIQLDGAKLRSSGVELLGSGIGSSPHGDIVSSITEFFQAYVTAPFRVDFEAQPLSAVEATWARVRGPKRIVFTVP